MLLKNIALITILGTASAYQVPPGTEDGVYSHHIDANGVEVHTKIGNATEYVAENLPPYIDAGSITGRKLRRDPGIACGAGGELDHGFTDAANADLDRQCDTYPPTEGRKNFYAIKGNVVAFYCNYRYEARKCTSTVRKAASAAITRTCGWYYPGWTTDDGYWSWGYHGNGKFCENNN